MATVNVYGELNCAEVDGKLARADQIYDYDKGKYQSEINDSMLTVTQSEIEEAIQQLETTLAELQEAEASAVSDAEADITVAKNAAIAEIEAEYPGSTTEVTAEEEKLVTSGGVSEWAKDDMGLFGFDEDTLVDKDGSVGSTAWISLGVTLAANTDYKMTITAIEKASNLAANIITRLNLNGSNYINMNPNVTTTPGAVTTWTFNTGTKTFNRLAFVNGSKAFSFHVKIVKFKEWTLAEKVSTINAEMDTLKTTAYQKAMQVNSESVFIPSLCCKDKSIVHVHVGSSTSAWQASDYLAPEGVCEVPATCDRQGLAYGMWVNSVFGNPQYRRYDYGKHSLVGEYCDKWDDDSEAFFTETGTWNAAYGNFTNAASSRTTLDTQVSPIPFDSAGNDIHIPRRYSSGASASVSFKIPAGYKRFAFIYNNNVLGDTASIAVNRGNGIVTMSVSADMSSAEEANGASFTTLYSGTASNVGYANQMIHFEISDTTAETTITITKSSDTTKYLIYWGIVYWSTAKEPYAHIFANNSRGGANGTTLNTHKAGTIAALNPDLVTYQITTTNNISETSPDYASAATLIGFISSIVTYVSNLGAEIAFVIQHRTKIQADANLPIVKDIYSRIVGYLNENNLTIFGNMAKMFDKVHQCYYGDLTYSQFVALLSMSDEKHLNTAGLSMYKALFSSINNN